MKVALITGSYPPDVCGTAEYTSRLCQALRDEGVDATVFYRTQWSTAAAWSYVDQLDQLGADIIHMQYPTTGYGAKLGPQLIGMRRRLVVTVHEASQAHVLRQISLYPFLLNARRFFFTNEFERNYVLRLAPWIAERSLVVPIGNNIPLALNTEKKQRVITCFSIIRPEKGLEAVLEFAGLLAQDGVDARVRITGALMPRWEAYYQALLARSSALPLEWCVGPSTENLANLLAESSLAYLPFPDGASERRSSLIAMLANGACTMTTVGQHTPQEMKTCIVPVSSPQEASLQAQMLFNDSKRRNEMAQAAETYAQKFEWSSIARRHVQVYSDCLRETED